MKNIIKIGLLASLMLVFGGCMDYKADYEDKDLTKFFMKNNKEKLSEIDVIEISRGEWGDTELTTYVFTPFFQSFISDAYIRKKIPKCKYIMDISSTNVRFSKKDILDYGKESMYREADKCLNAVLEEIELKKKSDLEKLENEKWETNQREQRLNRKFNPNEVK